MPAKFWYFLFSFAILLQKVKFWQWTIADVLKQHRDILKNKLFRRGLEPRFKTLFFYIDLIHKWWLSNCSFVFYMNHLASLARTKLKRIFAVKVRLVGMINTKSKEWVLGLHLWIRSIDSGLSQTNSTTCWIFFFSHDAEIPCTFPKTVCDRTTKQRTLQRKQFP